MESQAPGNGAAAGPGGFAAWVRQLTEPLVPTETRVATEARLVRGCSVEPERMAAVFGGLLADLVAPVPSGDPVRQLGARVGGLALPSGAGELPGVDGVTAGVAGLPVGFEVDYSEEGYEALAVFADGVPDAARVVLAFAGSGCREAGDSDALVRVVAGGPDGLTGAPWSAAAAALLAASGDEPSGGRRGVALAVTAGAAVRWALWNRRRFLADSWCGDGWPLKSARNWWSIVEVMGAGSPSRSHWSPGELLAEARRMRGRG